MKKNFTNIAPKPGNKIDLGLAAINDFYNTLCSEHLHTGGYDAYYTGIDSPFFNVILPSNKHALISNKLVYHLTSFLIDKKLPWSFMQVIPLDQEGKEVHDLQALQLQQMGLTILEVYPNLYCDLIKELPSIVSNNALQIVNCQSVDADLQHWSSVIRACYDTADDGLVYRKLNATLMQRNEVKLQHYIVYKDDTLVAAGTLFLAQHAVMLHNLATLKEFRHQGIGMRLTLFLMAQAKQLGFQHCFLDASPDGLSLYKKLGFTDYAVTDVYVPT